MTRQEIERANNMAKNRAINTITEHDLKPIHDKAKSFYGKATVIENADEIFLQSYDTIVVGIDKATGHINKYWNDWSATTGRHIKEFFLQYTGETVNKKVWDTLAA